jgi:ADP-ribose pyrophosphatase YjhB (NUDIX family)
MTNLIKDSHCSFCGTRFTEQIVWPRKCFSCYNDSYKNPIPVVVVLIPTLKRNEIKRYGADSYQEYGWLIEQRNINPEKGGWALPSGYIEFGETWQQAAAREMEEEVGFVTKPEEFLLLEVVNSLGGNMLIFCTHRPVYEDEIKFRPNHEVSAVQFPTRPDKVELCFPTHTMMWQKYYDSIDE